MTVEEFLVTDQHSLGPAETLPLLSVGIHIPLAEIYDEVLG